MIRICRTWAVSYTHLVVFFHHIAHIFHILGQAQGDVLAVAQQVLTVGNDAAQSLLGEDVYKRQLSSF